MPRLEKSSHTVSNIRMRYPCSFQSQAPGRNMRMQGAEWQGVGLRPCRLPWVAGQSTPPRWGPGSQTCLLSTWDGTESPAPGRQEDRPSGWGRGQPHSGSSRRTQNREAQSWGKSPPPRTSRLHTRNTSIWGEGDQRALQKDRGCNKRGNRLSEVKKGAATVTQKLKRWNEKEVAVQRNQLEILEMK